MSQNKIIGTDILLEFLEVALHNILYYRKLYPEEIFIRKKIYGTFTYVSLHPELNEYIKNILTSVKDLVDKEDNNLKSVNVTFLNENKIPIEKFTFNLDRLKSNISENDSYFIKTEETLRSLCLKLSMLENYLEPLPKKSSFIINIVTNYAAYVSLTENSVGDKFPWIIDDDVLEIQNGLLLPIKNLETDYLHLECFAIEDKKTKTTIA